MVMSRDGYDLRLTIDSVEYGLMLAEDSGVKQLNDGLAPFITPQFRTSSFGYDHTPPEIEVPMVAETWNGGAGFDLSTTGGGINTNVYNYSQGVDLSQNDRVFLSPKQQTALESDGTAIAAAPVKFIHTSLGFFMLAGAYIYEFDTTTTSTSKWVQRDDATGTFSGVAYKDLVELDGVLYASRGSTADYKYSTDGTTWTAFTDADENADYFTTRGNGSDIASVWKVLANAIKNTTNGANGGVAWSGADEVGHTAETTNGAVTVNNDIWVFKKEGVYVYDGTNSQDIWKTRYHVTSNGKNPFVWANGLIYVPYGRRLLEIDPFAASTTLRQVYPTTAMDSSEIKGDITAVGGNDYFLMVAVKNSDGNTYIMKGVPDGAWHTFLYLGANDCNALYVAPPGAIHATNPTLVIGYGTAAPYYILARENMHPHDDPLYQFATDEGVVYGPYFNFGAKAYNKFLNKGTILAYNNSAGRPVTLKYEINRDGTITSLVSATSEGTTTTDTSSEVEFNQIRYVLYLQSGDSAASPGVDSVTLYGTLNPPRKRQWQPVVVLSDDLELRGGVRSMNPSAAKLKEILYGAVNKRITLTHDDTHTHTVRLLDVGSTGVIRKVQGGREHNAMGYRLHMVEINSMENGGTEAVYDQSTYDSGHVYA